MNDQWWNNDESGEESSASNPPASPPPGSADMPTTGAWAGAQGAAPAAPVAAAPGRSGGVPWVVVIAAVIALVGGLLAYNSLAGDDDSVAFEGEIFLERADEPGDDPFVDEFDTLVTFDPAEVTPPNAGVAAAASRPASGGSSGGGSPPALSNAEILALTFNGAEPGLYGGTGNSATCNKAALVAFLEESPDKAAAWAGAQDIAPGEIRAFVDGLTTVALLADTRVTNHGFKNGVANPIQSVLQAGTAVMIDADGIPRVKCGCGNPLRKPIPQTRTVVVQGDPWPDFDPAAIATVEPAEEPVDTFVLADPATSTTVERPAGTDGEADTTVSAPAPQPLDDLAEAAAEAAAELESAAETTDDTASGAGGAADESDDDTEQAPAEQLSEPDPEPDVDPAPDPEPDPAPPALEGATYCEKYNSYVAEVDQYFASDDDSGFVAFLRRAVFDLAPLAPDELEADWQAYVEVFERFSDAELRGEDSALFGEFDERLDAADDAITNHAISVCGADI